jgi:hypothetical protein
MARGSSSSVRRPRSCPRGLHAAHQSGRVGLPPDTRPFPIDWVRPPDGTRLATSMRPHAARCNSAGMGPAGCLPYGEHVWVGAIADSIPSMIPSTTGRYMLRAAPSTCRCERPASAAAASVLGRTLISPWPLVRGLARKILQPQQGLLDDCIKRLPTRLGALPRGIFDSQDGTRRPARRRDEESPPHREFGSYSLLPFVWTRTGRPRQ